MEDNLSNEPENTIKFLKSKNDTFKTYIESLDPLHYKALTISIKELESSFSLEKSIGYIEFTNQSRKT
jgi:hypothetical protein